MSLRRWAGHVDDGRAQVRIVLPHHFVQHAPALLRRGRLGDVVETFTLLSLLPLMVLAAGFVDAVAGRPLDPVHSPPDYEEALRSHRLATAIARAAVSGAPERLR